MSTTPAAIGMVCNDDVEDDADDSPTYEAVAKAGAPVTPAAVSTSCFVFWEKNHALKEPPSSAEGGRTRQCLSQEWRDDAWLDSPAGASANPGLPQESSRHRTPSPVTMKHAVATVEVWVVFDHFSASSFSTMNSPPSPTGGQGSFALFRPSVSLICLSLGTATSIMV